MAKSKRIGATLVLSGGNFFANAKKAATSLKDLKKNFDNSSKGANSMKRAFGSAASGTASLTKSLLGLSAVRKTVSLVTGSIDSALERMVTMTNFKRTMTAISGSADAANQSLEALKGVTKGTAYGLDVAASAVQNFTTRGMSIDESTSEVAKWCDAVAFYGNGTNEALSTVTDALGKMLSKGKVEMEQQNRLTDNGINAAGIYAQATGRSVTAVLEDLQKGNISSKKFITTVSKAFTEGTNGVLNISGAAKSAGGTWATTISNMKAAVTRGVVSITEKTNSALQNAGFGTIQNGIKSFGEKMESVLGRVGDKVGEFVGKAAPFITNEFMPAVSNAVDYIMKNTPNIQDAVAKAIDNIEPTLSNIWEGIKQGAKAAGKMLSWVNDNWFWLKDAIKLTVGVIAGIKITKKITDITSKIKLAKKAVSESFGITMSVSKAAGGALKSIGKGAGTALKTVGKTSADAAKLAGKGAVSAAKTAGKGAVSAAKFVGKGTVELAKTAGKGTVTAAKAVGKGAVSAAKFVGKGSVELAKAAGKGTVSAAKAVGTGAVSAIKLAGKGITGVMGLIGKGISAAFVTSPVGWIVLAIAALITVGILVYKNWDKISAWFVNMWNKIKDGASWCWNGIKNVFSAIGGWFGRVFNSAKDAICKAFQAVRDFVKSIWDGVVGIIKGAINSVIKGMNSMISGAVNGINKLIGGINKVTGAVGIPAIPQITAPQIPMLATGGVITRLGNVIVGERGPEMLTLPRGAMVTPLPAGAGGNTYSNTFYVNVNADEAGAAERFVRRVKEILDNM